MIQNHITKDLKKQKVELYQKNISQNVELYYKSLKNYKYIIIIIIILKSCINDIESYYKRFEKTEGRIILEEYKAECRIILQESWKRFIKIIIPRYLQSFNRSYTPDVCKYMYVCMYLCIKTLCVTFSRRLQLISDIRRDLVSRLHAPTILEIL